jgi:hypothetical protein
MSGPVTFSSPAGVGSYGILNIPEGAEHKPELIG